MANVLIVGSGGREHAITWKLSQSEQVKKIFVAPGSYGIQNVDKAENVQINVGKFDVSDIFLVLVERCSVKVRTTTGQLTENVLSENIKIYLYSKKQI